MSPRPSLPGAEELFRRTDPDVQDPPSRIALAPSPIETAESRGLGVPGGATDSQQDVREPVASRSVRRGPGDRSPSGRQRHEEKITVYVSGSELVDLERSRLTLRAEHGLAIDRGRIVREALAVVLADLDAKGPDSILVRRLRGR